MKKFSLIGYKLIMGFVIVSFLVGIIGYIGLKGVDTISHSFAEVNEDSIPVLNSLMHLQHGWNSMGMEIMNYAFFGDAIYKERFNKWAEHFEEEKNNIKKREASGGVHWLDFIKQIEQYQSSINKIADSIFSLRDSGRLSTISLVNLKTIQELYSLESGFEEILNERINEEQNEWSAQKMIVFSTVNKVTNDIFIFSILIVIIGVVFGFFVSVSVAKPIKALAEEKNKINTIVQSIGNGVFVIDNNYQIILFNREMSEMSGFDIKEAIGMRYDQVLKFINENQELNHSDDFIKESIAENEIKKSNKKILLQKKNGYKIAVSGTAAPLKDDQGKTSGCVIVLRDVTKERKIEKIKDDFLALASHQLNSPLSIASWYSETLLDKETGSLNEEQKKCADAIHIASKRMIEMVDALLNVSRIDMGTLVVKPESVQIIKVAESVIKSLAVQSQSKNIKLTKKYGSNLPICHIDSHLTKVIFLNLISNAIKYTPKNGNVSLEIKNNDLSANSILVVVSDDGYGIPKKQHSKVFTKLFRGENIIKAEPDGNGLGLYIVKAIIDRFGGEIRFESDKNKGTTFYVTLPVKIKDKK